MSELDVLDRLEIVDVRELLVERSPGGQDSEQRRPRHRFDDESLALFPEQRLTAGELEISWNADCLIAPIPEQADASLGLHGNLPAALAAYAEA
jgi:hypothetical protein